MIRERFVARLGTRLMRGAGAGFALVLGIWLGAAPALAGLGISTQPVVAGGDPGNLKVDVRDALSGAPLLDAEVRVTRVGAQFQLRVSHAGYIPVLIFGAESGSLKVDLRLSKKMVSSASAEGRLEGWQPLRRDTVTAGAVFRSLSSSELVWLDPSLFISPWKDSIDVLGPRQIPSNVVIPEQTVDVPLSSIRLNKPSYRLPLQEGVESRLVAVQGQARVSDLLPLFQGGNSGSGLEVLNQLRFTRVGLSSELRAEPGQALRESIETVLDLKPGHQVTASAAPFSADVLLAAITDLSGDRSTLIPTDLKLAQANSSVWLSAPEGMMGRKRMVVALAMSRPQDPNAPEGDPRRRRGAQISAVLSDSAGKVVRLPSFPALQETLADFPRTAPDSVGVRGRSGGVGYFTLDSENETLGVAYILPGAGSTRLRLEDFGVDLRSVQAMDLRRFEFYGEFRPEAIDGETVLQRLARFTRSGARRLP